MLQRTTMIVLIMLLMIMMMPVGQLLLVVFHTNSLDTIHWLLELGTG